MIRKNKGWPLNAVCTPKHKALKDGVNYLLKKSIFFNYIYRKGSKIMSDEKGNLKGLAISFILISLIMGAGVGVVYYIGQSIY